MLFRSLAFASSAVAQQAPINPRIPPPPPPPEETAHVPTQPEAATPTPLPPVPATVEIAAGMRIPVVLDTPLSTRISKAGQLVTFRTTDSIRVNDLLEIPPDTEIIGTVVEARKPGGFGRPGTLKVKVVRIRLASGTATEMAAHLDSRDVKQGRISADKNGSANAVDLAQWAVLGTLIGWQGASGKGAGYGAAAGALTGLIIMMARRGPDLYLEPGMPFAVVVDQAFTLPGPEVQAAQENYARTHGPSYGGSSGSSASSLPDDQERRPGNRPVLKRRTPRQP